MPIIDTHAHLEQKRLSCQLEEVLQRAREAGITQILCAGTSLSTSHQCVRLAHKHPDILAATAGIHPTRCQETPASWLDALRDLAEDESVVAIGECGLDFHHDYSTPAMQKDFFRRHVQLSLDSSLPLIVHARKADPETLAIIEDETAQLQGVRHCFDSSKQIAQRYVECGMHIAFGGAITRAGHKKLKRAARWVPDERLLVETDCPYMTPEGVAADCNEPAYIEYTIRALASLRDQTTDHIADITTRNAKHLFFQ